MNEINATLLVTKIPTGNLHKIFLTITHIEKPVTLYHQGDQVGHNQDNNLLKQQTKKYCPKSRPQSLNYRSRDAKCSRLPFSRNSLRMYEKLLTQFKINNKHNGSNRFNINTKCFRRAIA